MVFDSNSGPPSEASSGADSSARPRQRRRVAILGFGGTVKDAPVADLSWELWGMNGFWRAAEPDYKLDIPEERYSLWFDMHTPEYLEQYGKLAGIEGKQQEWLSRPHPFPILTISDNPQWPSAEAFPLERVIKAFGRDYFTSTVAYCLAYALCLPDVGEIGLWGVDLVHSTEYGDQRPCAEYWIGRAEAAGIKVTIHEQSALLRQRGRYGYDEQNPAIRDMYAYLDAMEEHLAKALAESKEKHQAIAGQMHTDNGALQTIRGMRERIDIYMRGGRIKG